MDVTIGVDIGTYSIKAVAVSKEDGILDTVTFNHNLSIPKPGYAEHDPETTWWDGLVTAVRQLVEKKRFSVGEVRAVGISTIAPCVVALDANHHVLRPAILYGIDVRASKQVDQLNGAFSPEEILGKYGQRFSSQSAGPKILWVKEEEPGIFARAERFVNATTYLVHRMTGQWWLDYYLAPNYAPFFSIEQLDWDDEATRKYLGKDVKWPRLGWTGDIAGELTSVAAEELMLSPGTPVIIGSADAMTEAVAAAAVDSGDLFMMYGSSMFFIGTTLRPRPSPIFWMAPGVSSQTWALAGGMSTAGSLTRWIMNLLYPHGASFQEFFGDAKNSPVGANGLVLLPYFSGERTPVLDPDARGLLAGLSLKHNRADIARAVLEGVAYGIRHNVEAFEVALGPVCLVAAGGGVTDPFWPQIVSNVCQRPQRIMQNTHAAIGDALLAGSAVGVYSAEDMKELALQIGQPTEIYPDTSTKGLYDDCYQVFRNLYERTKEDVHHLSRQRPGYKTQG